MNVHMDKFGRLVLPKAVRCHLGLVTGSELMLETDEDKIILKRIDEGVTLQMDEGILVFNGKPNGSIEQALVDLREERSNHLIGP